MIKNTLIFTLILSFMCSSAFASSCKVPKFLKEGADVKILTGMQSLPSKIIEIDKKTCWVKTEVKKLGIIWINLNGIVGIKLNSDQG